nr:encapsulin [Acidipropionibacterium acidipropionici]
MAEGTFGTYFIGYAADVTTTETMLERMFIGDPPGTTDRILDFSTALTGALFFVPSQDALDDPDLLDPPSTSDSPTSPGPRDDSLGVGGFAAPRNSDRSPLQEGPDMNNLHRELAPISEAAWKQIDDEAPRNLLAAGRRGVASTSPSPPARPWAR